MKFLKFAESGEHDRERLNRVFFFFFFFTLISQLHGI